MNLEGSDCLELHWLSTSRMSHNEERRHTAFDLHSYCEMIEEQLYSRAFIATVYHALIEGFVLNFSFKFALSLIFSNLFYHLFRTLYSR